MTLWKDAEKVLCRADPVLGQLIKQVGPCTIRPQRVEPYAALLRSVAYQQLHGKAAATIFGRLLDLCGGIVPPPEQLLALDPLQLRACGFSEAKCRALRDIAQKAVEGIIPTRRAALRLSDEELIRRITVTRGVGRWTVEMMLMFTLGRPDVLPVDDFGVREGFKALYKKRKQPTPKQLKAYGAKHWAPYQTVASWYMWRALELSRVKS